MPGFCRMECGADRVDPTVAPLGKIGCVHVSGPLSAALQQAICATSPLRYGAPPGGSVYLVGVVKWSHVVTTPASKYTRKSAVTQAFLPIGG